MITIVAALMISVAEVQRPAAVPVSDTSFIAADGTHTMQLAVTIDAPIDAVWSRFSTADGWLRWGVKTAYVEFRPGGVIETSYDANKPKGDRNNIRNQIIDFAPGKMLVFRNIQAPLNFPVDAERFSKIVSTLKLESVGSRTTVTLSGSGYGNGVEDNKVYAFFVRANAFALESLKQSLETQGANGGQQR